MESASIDPTPFYNIGTIFDVTRKRDTYGPGGSYNIFAGKDGSKGLGKSSLKEEDAVPDYSDLPENELKVLNDWHGFFSYVPFYLPPSHFLLYSLVYPRCTQDARPCELILT